VAAPPLSIGLDGGADGRETTAGVDGLDAGAGGDDLGAGGLCCGLLLLLLFGLWPLAFTGLLTQSSPASKRANEPFLMALKSAAVVIESLFQFPSTSRARASG